MSHVVGSNLLIGIAMLFTLIEGLTGKVPLWIPVLILCIALYFH